MAAAGVSAVAYAASGDLVNAAIMTAGIALAAVGAGAAVVAAKAAVAKVEGAQTFDRSENKECCASGFDRMTPTILMFIIRRRIPSTR